MSLWKRLRDQYLNADESKFKTMDFFGSKTIMFVGKDETIDVFDGNNFRSSIYFSDEMKIALGLASGFPLELTLNPKSKLSIPAIQFSDKSKTRPLAEALINQKIYITPEQCFNCKFRDIFTHTQLTHNSGKESHKWLSRPEISYWNQQLNFAIFCSTTASGLSNRLLFEDKMSDGNDLTNSELHLPIQVRSVLRFHVYHTVRKILNEMGVPLPEDPVFNQKDNRYNITAYKSICAEFGIDPNSDFRFTGNKNNGLGSVYLWMRGPTLTNFEYPGDYKFSDEGGKAEDGDLIYFMRPKPEKQYEYFVTPVSYDLTKAGQARIKQSRVFHTFDNGKPGGSKKHNFGRHRKRY